MMNSVVSSRFGSLYKLKIAGDWPNQREVDLAEEYARAYTADNRDKDAFFAKLQYWDSQAQRYYSLPVLGVDDEAGPSDGKTLRQDYHDWKERSFGFMITSPPAEEKTPGGESRPSAAYHAHWERSKVELQPAVDKYIRLTQGREAALTRVERKRTDNFALNLIG